MLKTIPERCCFGSMLRIRVVSCELLLRVFSAQEGPNVIKQRSVFAIHIFSMLSTVLIAYNSHQVFMQKPQPSEFVRGYLAIGQPARSRKLPQNIKSSRFICNY